MIQWNEKISVNHNGIDEQHKKLIDIIEQISLLSGNKGHDFSQLLEVINELDSYIEEHFKYEEDLMSKYNYIEMNEHVKQHNQLREKMEGINIFEVEKTEEFYKELLASLVDWLLRHIMQTDKKLGAFLLK